MGAEEQAVPTRGLRPPHTQPAVTARASARSAFRPSVETVSNFIALNFLSTHSSVLSPLKV